MDPPAPADPAFAARVRDSFARQGLMTLLGATLTRVEPGVVAVALAARPDLTQHHGYLHAGVLAALADTASGYAALTLMPPGREVLSVEFKVNLLRPAAGARVEAVATVLKPGRTLTVTRADVFAFAAEDPEADGRATLVATMQATMIAR